MATSRFGISTARERLLDLLDSFLAGGADNLRINALDHRKVRVTDPAS